MNLVYSCTRKSPEKPKSAQQMVGRKTLISMWEMQQEGPEKVGLHGMGTSSCIRDEPST